MVTLHDIAESIDSLDLLHLSLCTGIGGFDLAAQWAGFKTVAFCECDKYAQKVLKKHWPDTPIIKDIKNVNREIIERLLRGNSINLITGGIPCQPSSVAGKRRGPDDDRWLWPEALRVLFEIKPDWAIFENPTGILTLDDGLVFDNLLSQMEAKGYEVQAVIIPACAVNAPHRRDRIFIVAHRDGTGLGERRGTKPVQEKQFTAEHDCKNLAYSESRRGRGIQYPGEEEGSRHSYELPRDRCGLYRGSEWWLTEPDVGRVVNGVSSRVDRLRCLGNAVVPQQVYPIIQVIADTIRTERGIYGHTDCS